MLMHKNYSKKFESLIERPCYNCNIHLDIVVYLNFFFILIGMFENENNTSYYFNRRYNPYLTFHIGQVQTALIRN